MGLKERQVRRLAAILAADVVGSSRLIEADEEAAIASIHTILAEVLGVAAQRRGGRLIKTMGDGALYEFASSVEAVSCAIGVQEAVTARASREPMDRRVLLRIGINLGDVIAGASGDLFGDGVNVAVRLESIADPGGIAVSGKVYDELQGKLGVSFEDRGEQRLKNMARPVRIYAVGGTVPLSRAEARLSLPDKPSIAVLPFTNMSGDPDQEFFADGIVEEITAALSRVRSFFVVARNSTFTYKGKAVDVRRVGHELGVRYVMEGSVRKAANRLRIVAQLVDATDGSHVWADHYDGELADIFDLQDRVTEAIVGAIEPTITLSEIERAKRKRPENLDAYECAMRALPAVWSQDADVTVEGLRLAERAAALDPTYPLPKAIAAWCYAQRVAYMRTQFPTEDRARALRLAKEAASLDSNDPLVLTVLSAAYAVTGQFDLGLAAIQKALALDPNSAWAWLRSGWANVYAGKLETAVEHFQHAMRLSPLDPMRFNALVGIGAAHFDNGQFEEAIRWLEGGLHEKPDACWTYRMLTAAYAHAGRLDDAKRAVALFLEAYPGMTVTRAVDAAPPSARWRERLTEGLRRAGLPE